MEILSRIKTAGFTLAGAMILMAVDVYNGFPLLSQDTGAFLSAGFGLDGSPDKPLAYGVFLRLSSLNGISLWLAAFSQCLALSYLLLLTFRDFTRLKNPRMTALGAISVLTLFTGAGFVAGQLAPDIFLPVALLCIWHLLFNDRLSKGETLLLFGIYTLANATQFTHLLIHTALLGGFLLTRNWYGYLTRFQRTRMLRRGGILILLTWASILTMTGPLSRSYEPLFIARMAESGLLQEYLASACPDHRYQICEFREQIPRSAVLFLQDPDSLLLQYGKQEEAKEEFHEIIWQSFLSPPYLLRHLEEAAKSSLRQLSSFAVGDNTPAFEKGSPLYQFITSYFPVHTRAFLVSKQNQEQMMTYQLKSINNLYKGGMLASLLGLMVLFALPRLREVLPLTIRTLILFLLVAILLNAVFNASFFMSADRFGAKVAWLIPLAFILALGQFRSIEEDPALGVV